jgi:hypothetical protein
VYSGVQGESSSDETGPCRLEEIGANEVPVVGPHVGAHVVDALRLVGGARHRRFPGYLKWRSTRLEFQMLSKSKVRFAIQWYNIYGDSAVCFSRIGNRHLRYPGTLRSCTDRSSVRHVSHGTTGARCHPDCSRNVRHWVLIPDIHVYRFYQSRQCVRHQAVPRLVVSDEVLSLLRRPAGKSS